MNEPNNAVARWLAVALVLGWTALVVVVYFVFQKPITAGQLAQAGSAWRLPGLSIAALVRTGLHLLLAAWVSLIALGLGLLLLRALRLYAGVPLHDRLVLGGGLGFGLYGLAVAGLGFIGQFNATAVLLLSTVLAFPAALQVWPLLRELRTAPVAPVPWLARGFVGASLALALLLALLPPTSFDGLYYHLTGPSLWLAEGGFVAGRDVVGLNFPALFEMLFLTVGALGADAVAGVLHWVFALLVLGLVSIIARDELALTAPWWAGVLLVGTPLVMALAPDEYNDLPLAFFSVLAVLAVWRWHTRPAPGWLVVAGLACGFAMGMKYTSALVPVTVAGLLLWVAVPRHGWGGALRHLALLAVVTTAVAAPWYLRNWLLTGNPVYPFVFGGAFWDGFRAEFYSAAGTGIGLDPVALLLVPLELTTNIRDASMEGPIGPLYLVLLPVVLVAVVAALRRRERIHGLLVWLLVFATASFAFWLVGAINSAALWQVRLLLPGLVALLPAMAWALEQLQALDTPALRLSFVLRVVFGAVLALALVRQTVDVLTVQPLRYLAGAETRADYLTRRLGPHFTRQSALAEQLGEDAVVALLWEPRSYYCSVDCHPDAILDVIPHFAHLYGDDAAAVITDWRAQGVTHVLVNEWGLAFVIEDEGWPGEPPLLTTLRSDYLIELDRTYYDTLYALP